MQPGLEAPAVRWDTTTGELRDSAGAVVYDGRDVKARRYVSGNRIKLAGATSVLHGYGQPHMDTETYELQPLPGCNETRRVVVRTFYNGAEQITAVDYRCDCQRSVRLGKPCSHSLAVHLHRKAP